MKLKKTIALILTGTLLSTALMACSTATPTPAPASTPAEETPAAPAPSEAAAPAEDVTVTLGFWGDSGESEAYQKAIENISSSVPGVKVELAQYTSTAEFWSNLPGQIAAGTAPDLIAPTNEGHMSYITEGLFVPIDEYGFDLSGINPNANKAWQYEGQQYAIPSTAAPGIFVVNMDLWNAAGLGALPTTWEEVYEAAKVLTTDDVKGLCIDFSQGYHPTQYMTSYGGGWGNGDTINSAENVNALDYIFKMYDEGLAINPKDLAFSWDGEVFAAGKAAMTTAGTWYVGFMAEAAPDINYEVVRMPSGNGNFGATLHTTAFAVLSNSKNPEMAAKVAYYLSMEDQQKAMAEIMGNMPSRVALQDWYFENNPKMASVRPSLEWASSFAYPVQATEFQNDLVRNFEEVYYAGQEKTSQAILDELAEKYKN